MNGACVKLETLLGRKVGLFYFACRHHVMERMLCEEAMAAHKEPTVIKAANACGTHLFVIPGGLTSKLQPIDIAVNHPFKTYIRTEGG